MMDWPELVKALKPLGFREFHEGHRMYHINPDDLRRVQGGFSGVATLTNRYDTQTLCEGPYADVVAYLQKVEKEKKP